MDLGANAVYSVPKTACSLGKQKSSDKDMDQNIGDLWKENKTRVSETVGTCWDYFKWNGQTEVRVLHGVAGASLISRKVAIVVGLNMESMGHCVIQSCCICFNRRWWTEVAGYWILVLWKYTLCSKHWSYQSSLQHFMKKCSQYVDMTCLKVFMYTLMSPKIPRYINPFAILVRTLKLKMCRLMIG